MKHSYVSFKGSLREKSYKKNKIEQSNYKSIKVLTIPILHENFVRDIRKRKTKNSIKIIVVLSYLSYLYLHHDDTILNKDH